jgi:tetratricopeptide (TPR) repeat protein
MRKSWWAIIAMPRLRHEAALQVRTPIVFRFYPVPQVSQLKRVVAAHPQDAEVWLGYAQTVRMTGSWARRVGPRGVPPEMVKMYGQIYAESLDLPGQGPRVEAVEGALARVAAAASVQVRHGPQYWLGNELGRCLEPPEEGAAEAALRRAVELAPDSSAVRFHWASYHLAQAGSPRLSEDKGATLVARSAEERDAVHRAREELLRCRELAPENAACDYLLAWTYLAEGEQDGAFVALRSGMAKAHWDTYGDDAYRAVLRCWDEIDMPAGFVARSEAAHWAARTSAVNRMPAFLAQYLAGLGGRARDSGDHRLAILCYEATVHLGHIMRAGATTFGDVHYAASVSWLAAGGFQYRRHLEELGMLLLSEPPDQLRQAVREAKRDFGAYLRKHGRGDLASFYARDLDEALKAAEGIAPYEPDPRLVRARIAYLVHLVADVWIWLLAAAMAALAALVWLVSVCVAYWREPARPERGHALAWVPLVIVLVPPGGIVVWIFGKRGGSPLQSLGVLLLAAGFGLMVALGAWLIGVWVLALRRRAARPAEERLESWREYLATLRGMVLATLAGLIFMSVISLWLVRARADSYDARCREILMEMR